MIDVSFMLILIYSGTLWLGVYLLRRNGNKPGMRYAGLGLISYAPGLVLAALLPSSRLHLAVTVLPALCWWQAVYHFGHSIRADAADQGLSELPVRKDHLRRIHALMVTATIFFVGGLLLLVAPQNLFASDFVLLLIGLDLLTLGYSIAVLDASDEGEVLLPDALRSLVLTTLGGLIFSVQVVLVMAIQGRSSALQMLLLGIMTAVILIPALTPRLQRWLDGWLLAGSPRLRQERQQLDAVYRALPRQDNTLKVLALDVNEFTRLTRRALAHLGDLERLATSPLIQLPLITRRLAEQQVPDSTLMRANILKAVLTERIEHLRPAGDAIFGTTDEWRYYNALYFPYVVGLKPYRRYPIDDPMDEATRAALKWFQVYVPERTLYNWQNKAAGLIARDLREQHDAPVLTT